MFRINLNKVFHLSTSKIKVLIADNQLLVREGIRALLANNKEFKVIGEVLEGKSLPEKVKQYKPDVVIIDYHLPGFFSIEDIGVIYEALPKANVLVVTTNQNQRDIKRVLEYGVNNYIFKLCDKNEFIRAVYATARKERFFCGKVIDAIMQKHFSRNQHCEPASLSSREIEVIKLIAEGMTNHGIAHVLHLSFHTVSAHRKNIFKKLNLKKASELIMYAIRAGIVKSHED